MNEYSWQKINIPCPKCAQDENYNLELWVHGDNCKGLLMINSSGMVRCSKCGKTAHISKMRMSCDSQSHTKYIPTTKEIASSLAIMSGISKVSIHWFKQLLDNL